MVQTLLLKTIIENAEKVMIEFGGEYITASHVVVAVADFCKTRYNGLDSTYLAYPRFEEERLRYIFKKEIKLAGYIRLALSINTKMSVDEKEFDVNECEKFALTRGADILSSDVVFAYAITQLSEKYQRNLRTVSNEGAAFALLEDADKNIYDYTITEIETVCDLLKKKAEQAAKLRDWKPAAKFIEPEDLIKQLFENISTRYENNVLHVTIPEFLPDTDLKLSIYKVNDCFIIHDNGCAVECLLKRIDSTKVQRVLDLLWNKSNLQDNKIFTMYTSSGTILDFIQEVILTANADLYFEYFKEESGRYHYIDYCNIQINEQQAQDFDVNALLESLKETVNAFYNENKGLELLLDTKYNRCSYKILVLIETLENGKLRFSDGHKNKKYETGEMLEAFYSGSDSKETDMYYKVMQNLAEPFGIVFDMTSSIIFPEYNDNEHNHKNPYMLSVADNWVHDFYKFMNGAVLISVIADRISYKKIREW